MRYQGTPAAITRGRPRRPPPGGPGPAYTGVVTLLADDVEADAGRRRPVDEGPGCLPGDVYGLFDHEVLAGPGCHQADLGMQPAGHAHADDVDLVPGQQGVERGVVGHAVGSGEPPPEDGVDVGDGHQAAAVQAAKGSSVRPGYDAAPNQAETERQGVHDPRWCPTLSRAFMVPGGAILGSWRSEGAGPPPDVRARGATSSRTRGTPSRRNRHPGAGPAARGRGPRPGPS